MSFRCVQPFRMAKCKPVVQSEQIMLESGEMVYQNKDLGEEKLPDPELFDLSNQLKAGVDLQEVNSKVFKPSNIDANALANKYFNTNKQDTNKKVNDEN